MHLFRFYNLSHFMKFKLNFAVYFIIHSYVNISLNFGHNIVRHDLKLSLIQLRKEEKYFQQ